MKDIIYRSFEDLDKIMNKVASDVTNSETLLNKYHYLGWYGAEAWKKVERKYKHGKEGLSLIEHHFDTIHKFIKEENKNKAYDIISLGVGTGDDDEAIIEKIANDPPDKDKEFNIILVDLSWNLLLDGAQKVYSYLNEISWTDFIKVIAVCCDIEKLSKAKEFIKFYRYNKGQPALFHLLGLTLSNNLEKKMLKKIANGIMENGDFLLIEVDLSKDNEKALLESKKAYEEGEARKYIDQFLLSTLKTAIVFHINGIKRENKDVYSKIELISKIYKKADSICRDYIKFNILHTVDESNNQDLTDVENTTILTRYHLFGDSNNNQIKRLCDYSTKYTSKDFEKFLVDLKLDKIPLELAFKDKDINMFGIKEDEKGSNKPYLSLILLRKDDSIINIYEKAIKVLRNISENISKIDTEHKNDYIYMIGKKVDVPEKDVIKNIMNLIENNEINIIKKIEELPDSKDKDFEKKIKIYLNDLVKFFNI